MELAPHDILDGFGGNRKRYGKTASIAGVDSFQLGRVVDDRGLLLELYRNTATHPGSEKLARFFQDFEIAQINYTLVTTTDHVKGLHYHLKQTDTWFRTFAVRYWSAG